MNTSQKILKQLLLSGALYFFLVSLAHMIGIKIPGLFIYFNVPSYAYQDKIISFLAFGWAMFLYSGFRSVKSNVISPVKYILASGVAAIVGLSVINRTTDFNSFSNKINPGIFWLEIVGLCIYLIVLTILYYRVKNNRA
ncbi:MAG: hypothetical protein ABIH71_07580 [Candidatus Omnitrophota bacterium]|nr:hypothetical protein [Candidatus Omnitrophota bacterium]